MSMSIVMIMAGLGSRRVLCLGIHSSRSSRLERGGQMLMESWSLDGIQIDYFCRMDSLALCLKRIGVLGMLEISLGLQNGSQDAGGHISSQQHRNCSGN